MKALKLAGCALLLAMAATAARAEEQHPTDDECYSRAEDGTCLDAPAVPATGQFQGFDSPDNGHRPADLRDTQHHANVVLKEDTFVYAHQICRWVGNATTHGVSFFIGLEKKEEWLSFLTNPPVGADIEKCCKPLKIERCGRTITVGGGPNGQFGKVGTTYGPYTSGYDLRSTYRCVTGVDGEGASADTSWLETSTGSCDPDQPTDNGGGGSDSQGNGQDGGGNQGGESKDGNGDGHGDGATDGPDAKGNDGQCGGGKC